MKNKTDEILLSQLADGELESDRINEVLLDVLDDADKRRELKEHLRLRKSLGQWRRQKLARPIVALSGGRGGSRFRHFPWRLGSLAAAACVGGLLVLAGIWAAGWLGRTVRTGDQRQIASRPGEPPAVAQVSPEQMEQVAKVFALHESVAGPLAWYAADDQNVRLASARGAEAGQPPIAVLLRLESQLPGSALSAGSGQAARTLVIVCREDAPAVIELPAEKAGQAGLRVYLAPKTVNGKVEMHYAIAMDGDSRQPVLASLTGQRRLGLAETSLGQLALGDRVLNVEAAAWALPQEGN